MLVSRSTVSKMPAPIGSAAKSTHPIGRPSELSTKMRSRRNRANMPPTTPKTTLVVVFIQVSVLLTAAVCGGDVPSGQPKWTLPGRLPIPTSGDPATAPAGRGHNVWGIVRVRRTALRALVARVARVRPS